LKVQSYALRREKTPRFAGVFTAEAVTLNFSKYLVTFAHLLMKAAENTVLISKKQ